MADCDGICVSTAEAIADVSVGLAAIALIFGLGASQINSFAGFIHAVKKHRSQLTQRQSYPPGVDPFFLVSTLQYLATLCALDRGQLPESIVKYLDRFKWSLFLVDLDTSKLRKTCDVSLRNEVYGAACTIGFSVLVAFVLREILRRICATWSHYYSGYRDSPPFLLFPHWELVVFLVQYLPYCVIAGKLIGSSCWGWTFLGLTAFVFVPLLGCIMCFHVCRFGLETEPHAQFEHSKHHKQSGRLETMGEFCLPTGGGAVGKWKAMPGETSFFGTAQLFLLVFGKLFETYRVEVWYYGAVVMTKKMTIGLCFALKNVQAISTALTVIYFSEGIFLSATQPHSEFKLFFRCVVQTFLMCTLFSFMLGHANGDVADGSLSVAVITIATMALWIGILDQVVTGVRELLNVRKVLGDMEDDSNAEIEQFKKETHRFMEFEDGISRPMSENGEAAAGIPREIATVESETADVDPHLLSQTERRKKLVFKKHQYSGLTKTLMDHEMQKGTPRKGSLLTDSQQRELEGAKARLINLGHWSNDSRSKVQEPGTTQVVASVKPAQDLREVLEAESTGVLPPFDFGGFFNRSWVELPEAGVVHQESSTSSSSGNARGTKDSPSESTGRSVRNVELMEVSTAPARDLQGEIVEDQAQAARHQGTGAPLNPFGLFSNDSYGRKSSLESQDITLAAAQNTSGRPLYTDTVERETAAATRGDPKLDALKPIGKSAADMRARYPVHAGGGEANAQNGTPLGQRPSQDQAAQQPPDRLGNMRAAYGVPAAVAEDPQPGAATRANTSTMQALKERVNARLDKSKDAMELLQENVQATAGDVTGENASHVSHSSIRQRMPGYKLPGGSY